MVFPLVQLPKKFKAHPSNFHPSADLFPLVQLPKKFKAVLAADGKRTTQLVSISSTSEEVQSQEICYQCLSRYIRVSISSTSEEVQRHQISGDGG